MGAIIKSVATAKPIMNLFQKGAIALEGKAVRNALGKAGIDPNKLDVVINTGLYRDDHVVEPSMASLVQGDAGACLEFDGKNRTFSFDVYNSASGLMTAIQMIDGYLQTGFLNLGVVVAGDSEPRPGLSMGYNFVPAAGAVILAPGKDGVGFQSFRTDNYLEYIDDYVGRVEWNPKGAKKKTHYLVIKEKKGYLKHCVECSQRSLDKFLKEAKLKVKDIDLLVTSQTPKGFVEGIKKKTGLGKEVVDVTNTWGNINTAGPVAVLEELIETGQFKASKNVVFLTVGSGITVALALYKNKA